ncbi:MAG: TRAP transporter substrate-binding protein DctP [Rhodospirillales bacterium]|nr:TRAP transporter substrate-binding protein DctP [Rhodospirillales bacterium]
MASRGLPSWDNGMRVIAADRPLPIPRDARGLTFRIEPSAIFQAQYERIGVIAIQMPFKQLPQALKRGLVNGLENSWSNIYASGLYPLKPRFTETNHSFLGYMVVTSAEFWDGLPDDVRSGLERILDEVSIEERRIAAEKAVLDREHIASGGNADIIVPTPEQLQAWRDSFEPVRAEFTETIGEEVIDAAIRAGEPKRE